MTDVLDGPSKDPLDDLMDVPRPDVDLTPADLIPIVGFGSNPGNLGMRLFVPEGDVGDRPLVVVLHGCRQAPDGYDRASGWSRLARQHDFMLLYPEQRSDNNGDLCFSWFQRDDIRRGSGEVESIRQMIETALADHAGDRRHVFVCGLSAGGAMAGAMLATYPELFAGGAIIAGLPYGTASDLHEAFESMSSGRVKDAKVWGDLVRAASPHDGPWPSVAIWHGTADNVVKPINAGEIAKQWTNIHGLGAAVPTEDHIGGAMRRVWRDRSGRICVTDYSVPNLGHGAPVLDTDPPAPFFLPAGVSSSWHIANDWGILGAGPKRLLLPDTTLQRRRRLLSFLGL